MKTMRSILTAAALLLAAHAVQAEDNVAHWDDPMVDFYGGSGFVHYESGAFTDVLTIDLAGLHRVSAWVAPDPPDAPLIHLASVELNGVALELTSTDGVQRAVLDPWQVFDGPLRMTFKGFIDGTADRYAAYDWTMWVTRTVPEPGTLSLGLAGLAAVAWRRRRER